MWSARSATPKYRWKSTRSDPHYQYRAGLRLYSSLRLSQDSCGCTCLWLITPQHVLQPPVDVVDAGLPVQTLFMEDRATAEEGRHGLKGVEREAGVQSVLSAHTREGGRRGEERRDE